MQMNYSENRLADIVCKTLSRQRWRFKVAASDDII